MPNGQLGTLLKNARLKKNFSQADIAKYLKLQSAQSVSDWERGYGSGVPVQALKKLVKLYELDPRKVFDAVLNFQQSRLEADLRRQFFATEARVKKPVR